MSLVIGLKGRAETVVTDQNTAAAAGSGLVPVFATPWMVALMEHAAVGATAGCLSEGESTVGTRLDITHDAATPIGMKVWADAVVTAVDGKLTEINGKALTFSVAAYDESGLIGKGVHGRFIIAVDRFLAKAEKKREVR